jgi:hypothetical protein
MALCDQKRARIHEGQPSAPIKGASLQSTSDVPTTIATSTSRLLSTEPIMTIEAASTNLGTCTMP